MRGGRNTFAWALRALTVVLIAAVVLPVSAAAQNDEYDLNLPGSGSGSSESEGTTAPTAPLLPSAPTSTTPTTELSEGGKRKRRRDRREGPTDPVLTTSAVNASAGPQEIPTLEIPDDGGGVPTLALLVASLAAACCILALWRLRFLRELPAAPRPRTPRAEPSS